MHRWITPPVVVPAVIAVAIIAFLMHGAIVANADSTL
jgi:hypothetical protein